MGHESVQAMYPAVQSAADGACPLMEAAFGAGAESGDFYMPCDLVQGTQVGMPVKCISAGVPTPSAEHIVKKYVVLAVVAHTCTWLTLARSYRAQC